MIKNRLLLKKCLAVFAACSLSFIMLPGCGMRPDGSQGKDTTSDLSGSGKVTDGLPGQDTVSDLSGAGTEMDGSQGQNAAADSSASGKGADGSQGQNAAADPSASGTEAEGSQGRDIWETYRSWDEEMENPGEGSSFIYGYIKGCGDRTLMIDQIEWITDDDKERVEELIDAGVIGDGDIRDGELYPTGYFIYNEDEEPVEIAVDEEAEFIFLDAFGQFDTGDGNMYLTGDFEEFSAFVNAFLSVPVKPYGPPHGPAGGPFVFEIKDGAVRKVYERIIAG